MSAQQYEVTFELQNGQWLTTEHYNGDVTISEIFLNLKINYDWVEELNLDSEWIVESRGTKKVFTQCEDSISTVLGNLYKDTFTFQRNGTIGLEIYKWQLDLKDIVGSQTSFDMESIMNYMQLGEQLFTEEEYYEALQSYFNVLALDPKNQQAIQRVGNCLAFLKCQKCLIVFQMLLKIDPENNEYKFYMARGLNLLNKFEDAQKILNQFENKNFGKKSYVQQEISLNKQKLGIIEQPFSFNKQQWITQKQNQKNSNIIQQQNIQEDESNVENQNLLIQQNKNTQENNDLDNQFTKSDEMSQKQDKKIDDSNLEQKDENKAENQTEVDDKQDTSSKIQDDQNNKEI